jgi:signal transduction histidine kinase/ActR/RegA family two-component response regulator
VAAASEELFDAAVWAPALQKYGAVTHLTVALFDQDGKAVREPVPPTPLFSALARPGFDPGAFAECAGRCLAQAAERPAVVMAPAYGLAVVGTSLSREGVVVGAAVAGYALIDFPSAAGIERLARAANLSFPELWTIARQQQPVPRRRLALHGELLQVLGDSLLRENHRTRQYEEMAASLRTEVAAKDEFLAVLSHELRTPLSPILTWAQVIEQRADDAATCRKAAGAIERSARLQAKLVDDLLDLSRVTRGIPLTLDVAAQDLGVLVRSALESTTERAADKGVALDVRGPEEPLPVNGDAGRLLQVFLNVLSNAVKFTPAGGRVGVILGREGETARVRVTDTGVGIAPDFLPRVFEMFSQQETGTRRQHPGLGIGMALVKRLVELHGGSVEVRSGGTGLGTEVTIRLPLDPKAPRTGDVTLFAGARPPAVVPLAELTILVVEDTFDTLDSMTALLESLGATVLAAGDGREALEVLERSRPDLVLCDLRMPRMDGFEFLRELTSREGARHPPVVAVSGLGSEADRRRTGEAGFVGHLVKPTDEAVLVSSVLALTRPEAPAGL